MSRRLSRISFISVTCLMGPFPVHAQHAVTQDFIEICEVNLQPGLVRESVLRSSAVKCKATPISEDGDKWVIATKGETPEILGSINFADGKLRTVWKFGRPARRSLASLTQCISQQNISLRNNVRLARWRRSRMTIQRSESGVFYYLVDGRNC